jgi:DNA-directed RNA polymerase subunit RPC12/RpoP
VILLSDFKDLLTPVRFNFVCFKCNQEFNLNFQYTVGKEQVICPNCGQVFEQNLLEKLKACVKELDEVLDELHDHNAFKTGWAIRINWNNYEPERPHEYSHLTVKTERQGFIKSNQPDEEEVEVDF